MKNKAESINASKIPEAQATLPMTYIATPTYL